MGQFEGRIRVAIVGSGPAGAYAADRLLRSDDIDVEVELFDRLPTPWGLVRAGVAPDHPKIKSVTRVFERTADLPGLRFHGGIEVGTTITHEELVSHHHAVLYAHGASADRRLGVPGEDLRGNVPAPEFVAWYNGHPDAHGLAPGLAHERAVVVGNGNVALDVARMLVLDPEELRKTDAADHAIDVLAASSITEVVVLGRRGATHASWTLPELRELGELDGVDVIVEDPGPIPDGLTGPELRAAELIRGYAERPATGAPRRIVLRFLASPVEILGDDEVDRIRVARNELVEEDGQWRARATAEVNELACGLVVRSIGYRGSAVHGLPFDERAGTVPNADGRVLDGNVPVPGVYAAGWIKRGPSGVIGTNKKCANETVAALLEDLAAGRVPTPPGGAAELDTLLAERDVEAIDVAGWRRIDAHEQEAGGRQGRPRVKLTQHHELRERAVRS